MAKIHDGKFITNKDDVEYLLSLEEHDLTISLIIELLGKFNGKRRFEPFDYIKIPPNSYGSDKKKNKNEFTTTVGLWIFNRLCIEKELFNIIGYVNTTVDDDKFNDIKTRLSYALLEDDIQLDALKHFLLKSQIMMKLTTVLAAHYTDDILSLSETLAPLKNKLISENKKAISDGNEVVAEQIEKELIAKTKEILKDDESMEIFNSGARGNIGNNLKNLCMMKGAVYNHVTGKYEIATSNYMDGISKEDYHIFANSIAPGAASRAIKTQTGGYWEKLLFSGFQHVKIGKPGSDCGTTEHVTVKLTNKNIASWMYSYIIEGSKLVELNSKNKDSYIGKTVKFRFAAYCKSKDYLCEHCCGTLFRKLGMENIGMLMPKLGSTIKQRCLKCFHDSTVKTTDISENDMLFDVFGLPKPKLNVGKNN